MTSSLSSRVLTLTCAALCSFALTACGKGGESKGVAGDAPPGQESVGEAAPTPIPGHVPGQLPGAPAAPAKPVPPPETVIMTVNGTEVRQEDFERVLNQRLRGAAARMPADRLAALREQLRTQIEDQLIMDVLLDGAVVAEGLAPTAEEIAAEWKKLEAQLPAGMTLDQALAQQGYDKEKADQAIRQFIGHNKLYDKIGGKKEITDEEARAYYDQNLLTFQTPEQVSARHILFRTDASTPQEKIQKKKEIDALREELVATDGKDFEKLAMEHSDCPSKSEGGSLGEFGRGAMVPEFDKTAFDLPVGEISPVIETQFGYHVLRVDKKNEAGTKPFKDVAESIKKRLAGEHEKKLVDAYRDNLKKSAKIERMTAPEAGIAVKNGKQAGESPAVPAAGEKAPGAGAPSPAGPEGQK